MSVIACQVTDEAIYIAADSAVTYGSCDQVSIPGVKIFEENGNVAGVAGDPEHAALFRYFLRDLEWQYVDDDNVPNELNDQVISNVYQLFEEIVTKSGQDLRNEDGNPVSLFILVARGKAFVIQGAFAREITTYEAIGCGDTAARAALYVGASIERAVAAAIVNNIHCTWPILSYRIDKVTDSIDLTTYDVGDRLPR